PLDLLDSLRLFKLHERLVPAPVEGVAVALVRHVLEPLRLLKHFRVLFFEPDPFDLLLEEAKEAPGSGGAPIGVLRKPQAALLKDPDDVPADEPGFLEGIDRGDVRLMADVADPVLVRPDGDVIDHRVVTHVLLERLEFEHLRAPTPVARWD